MNKTLNFTQEQVTKILENIAIEKDDFNKVTQLAMKSLIRLVLKQIKMIIP